MITPGEAGDPKMYRWTAAVHSEDYRPRSKQQMQFDEDLIALWEGQ